MAGKAELAVFVALFLAPAVAIWSLALRDASALSLHAALNAAGVLVCTPAGLLLMLERKQESRHTVRVRLAQWHLGVNVAATLLVSVSGVIAFAAKRAAGEKHFASRHSWAGLAVASFLALNVFQGLLLTYEGKRANWQWKDETHVLVGTLVYVGSAVALVYGVQSEQWAMGLLGSEWRQWLAILIGVAHTALLAKMARMSKSTPAASVVAAASKSE